MPRSFVQTIPDALDLVEIRTLSGSTSVIQWGWNASSGSEQTTKYSLSLNSWCDSLENHNCKRSGYKIGTCKFQDELPDMIAS